jgi:3-oxoacyl-(acyl-carrier-protein) synthase
MFFFSTSTGAGVILCIEKALVSSGVSREDVNYINAHATSTPAGDLKEYQALIHCFGKNPEVNFRSYVFITIYTIFSLTTLRVTIILRLFISFNLCYS